MPKGNEDKKTHDKHEKDISVRERKNSLPCNTLNIYLEFRRTSDGFLDYKTVKKILKAIREDAPEKPMKEKLKKIDLSYRMEMDAIIRGELGPTPTKCTIL